VIVAQCLDRHHHHVHVRNLAVRARAPARPPRLPILAAVTGDAVVVEAIAGHFARAGTDRGVQRRAIAAGEPAGVAVAIEVAQRA
jgi:hypothetical protein